MSPKTHGIYIDVRPIPRGSYKRSLLFRSSTGSATDFTNRVNAEGPTLEEPNYVFGVSDRLFQLWDQRNTLASRPIGVDPTANHLRLHRIRRMVTKG